VARAWSRDRAIACTGVRLTPAPPIEQVVHPQKSVVGLIRNPGKTRTFAAPRPHPRAFSSTGVRREGSKLWPLRCRKPSTKFRKTCSSEWFDGQHQLAYARAIFIGQELPLAGRNAGESRLVAGARRQLTGNGWALQGRPRRRQWQRTSFAAPAAPECLTLFIASSIEGGKASLFRGCRASAAVLRSAQPEFRTRCPRRLVSPQRRRRARVASGSR